MQNPCPPLLVLHSDPAPELWHYNSPMYPISLVTIGKPKEAAHASLGEHYLKLVRPYAKLEVVELPEGKAQGDKQLLEEAQRVRNALSRARHRVLLCPEGVQRSSEAFASWLGAKIDLGEGIAFAIGSSEGFHESLKIDIPDHLSLGPMTFPHDLCRVLLLEQIYRAFTILRGKVYHK